MCGPLSAVAGHPSPASSTGTPPLALRAAGKHRDKHSEISRGGISELRGGVEDWINTLASTDCSPGAVIAGWQPGCVLCISVGLFKVTTLADGTTLVL